jgi:hypothetical protein
MGANSIKVATAFKSNSSDCIMTTLRARRARNRGSIPGRGKSIFLLHSFNTGSGAQANYPKGIGVPFSGVKQPRREAEHAPTSSTEIKK